MDFQDLPVETIVRILSFLNWSDLLSISQLNHFFRNVYYNFPELQYSFALQVSGMIDNNPSLDIRCKLNEIQRQERAWRMMDLSSRNKVTVKVPHSSSHIYDLSGGVYLLGDCKNSTISRDTHTLRFFDLTGCSTGPALRSDPWPEMKIDANIVDIGFGLNEFDLVAIVGIKPGQNGEQSNITLSLRELSTGAPHPFARHPDIVIDPIKHGRGKLSIMLEVVGPRLLLLLTWHRTLQRSRHYDQDKLLLFNWWEGTKVMAETSLGETWNGFVFLSPDLVLLPDREHGLEIIRLPDVTGGYSSKGFERILRLTLPALQPLVKVGGIQCRSEPNPFGAPHPSVLEGKATEFIERMRNRRRRPFEPDPMKAVVLLQIYYREFNNEPHDLLMGQWGVLRHNVSLIVHRELLLQLVDMFANKSRSLASPIASLPSRLNAPMQNEGNYALGTIEEEMIEPTVPTVPWAQWGPHARWMADDTHVSNWITTSAGQRYVGTDEESHVVVKDFNPVNVRRVRAAVEAMSSAAMGKGDTEYERADGDEWAMGWDEDGSRSREFRIGLDDSGSESEPVPQVEGVEQPSLGTLMDGDEPVSEGGSTWTRGDSVDTSVSQSTHYTSAASTSPQSAQNLDLPLQSPSHSDEKGEGQEEEQEDQTWRTVRLIEGYNEIEDIELRQLFTEECKWPLACVEYVSDRRYDHHGLLMDEERIIGLKHDDHTGAIVEFDVFTL